MVIDRDASQHSSDLTFRHTDGKIYSIENTTDFISKNIGGEFQRKYLFLDALHSDFLDLFDYSSGIISLQTETAHQQIYDLLKYNLTSLATEFIKSDINSCLKCTLLKKRIDDENLNHSHTIGRSLLFNQKMVDNLIQQTKYWRKKYGYFDYISSDNLQRDMGNDSSHIELLYKFSIDDSISITFPVDLLFSGISGYENIIKSGYYLQGLKLTLDSSYILNMIKNGLDNTHFHTVVNYVNATAFDSPYFFSNYGNQHISDTEVHNIPYTPQQISDSHISKKKLRSDLLSYFQKFNEILLSLEHQSSNTIMNILIQRNLVSENFFENISRKYFKKFLEKYLQRFKKNPEIARKDIDMLMNALCNNVYRISPELIVTEDTKLKVMAYLVADYLKNFACAVHSGFKNNKNFISENPHRNTNFYKQQYGVNLGKKILFNMLFKNPSTDQVEYYEIS